MSPAPSAAGEGLRAIAFASPDGEAWGAAVSDGAAWSLVLGPAGAQAPSAGALRLREETDGGWRLEGGGDDAAGDGSTLLIEPLQAPAPAPPAADESESESAVPPGAPFVPGVGPELCRVSGTVAGRALECPGIRVRVEPSRSAKDAPGTARFVAGWFADGSAVGLIAARSRRSDRPDQDAVSANIFDPEAWLAVSEPRLSTTYAGSGTPSRVNLELWVGDGEQEYPRRTAGEVSGAACAGAEAEAGTTLQVVPLRCHSRGEEGIGVYVLATF